MIQILRLLWTSTTEYLPLLMLLRKYERAHAAQVMGASGAIFRASRTVSIRYRFLMRCEIYLVTFLYYNNVDSEILCNFVLRQCFVRCIIQESNTGLHKHDVGWFCRP